MLLNNTAKANTIAIDAFWYMVNERHLIYLKKTAKEPKPWSKDPIFQEWKFCNVFRTLDKQSKWLIQNVIEPHKEDNQGLLLFNIFAFRAFNINTTYMALLKYLHNAGFKENAWIDYWDEETVKGVLSNIVESKQALTSGAYMIRGFLDKPKWESIPETLSVIWDRKNALAEYISKYKILQTTVETLLAQKFWGWGPFTCYQIALDLSYTPILESPRDINAWCEFGPGAKRGIEILYPGIKKDEYLDRARALVVDQSNYLEDYMPNMTLQDIEFSLCEFQKYWRILNGGRGKERYLGKAT